MAKRNKIKKRARYHGGRADYRGGGRVALARGSRRQIENESIDPRKMLTPKPKQPTPSKPVLQPAPTKAPRPIEQGPQIDKEPIITRPTTPQTVAPLVQTPIVPSYEPEIIKQEGESLETEVTGGWWVEYGYDTEQEAIDSNKFEQDDTGVWTPIGLPNEDEPTPSVDDPNAQPDKPTDGRLTWWEKAGYSTIDAAIAAGYSFDHITNTWVAPSSSSSTQDNSSNLETQEEKDAKQSFGVERRERINRTAEQSEALARGEIPEGTIPKASVEDISMEETTATAEQMGEITKPVAVTAADVTPETVRTGTTTTTKSPDQIVTSQMDAAQTGSAEAIAAQSRVSEDAELTEDEIAKAADVSDVAPIEGVDVQIEEGALTARVVGVMSESAKSVAAQNTGSSLRKLSRAKKQLRKAGLTEDQIGEIGDDIESLEDRLDDFTEEQRGLIAGVDKDTLVDAQMNRLLDGMENGEIPIWAQGAVGKVEQMLATRGLSASSIGRAELTNAILQSALPMAQSNASALQQAATQQRDIEAKESEANTQRRQQTSLTNAQNVFNIDMAQFSSDQQIALSNSKFMQTVSLTNATNDQQATLQNAIIQSQINLAEADAITKLTAQNAQAFLSMDMANLSNDQQSRMLTAQNQQQTLLSNQAATNASRQFNAASENQTNQFMASLATQVDLNNTQQLNAMEQFNASSQNAAEARRAGIEADLNKANAAMVNQVNQQNAQLDFNREQWNTANRQAVEQSNVSWRRQANTANTAAQNSVNQQNAQNAFGLSMAAQSFLWQELRDQADYDFRWADNEANREASAIIAAIGNEAGAAENWSSSVDSIKGIIDKLFGS